MLRWRNLWRDGWRSTTSERSKKQGRHTAQVAGYGWVVRDKESLLNRHRLVLDAIRTCVTACLPCLTAGASVRHTHVASVALMKPALMSNLKRGWAQPYRQTLTV